MQVSPQFDPDKKPHVFRGRFWHAPETIRIDNQYVVYKKRASFFSPLYSITVPKLSISSIDFATTLTGVLLKITTFSNNNILSRSFSKKDVLKIKKLTGK